ncbi:polyketide antibiotic transporter [Microbacterium bovistercoris]|uniref:Polyketide antibiotic transporter n=1 Tax=Microbacterium bovistercoris TaxID=2293570 RepID=A0A371NYH1_9MICO|nr:polyketide antibiotic transporter [Microbacterium bovistercoris]REJ08372.1 polyketide antibiotic transporter [Microbacterium bovistercoris]
MNALLRQRLRRDRVQLLLWILGTVALAATAVGGVTESYGDLADRTAVLATVMANPVILMFRGLPSGAGEAQVALFLILPFLAMLAAFMSTFLAVRHTRAEEEQGRAELISATPAARVTPLAATIVHGMLANVVLGLLISLVYLGSGYPAAGSWIVGLATASVGLCFLGVGLLSAQLMRTSRGANSLAVWILVATYVMAGLGNALGTPSDDLTRMESGWLAWLSPFGWAENTRPYADDAVWPALLGIGVGALLTAVAFAVQSVRDLGEGIVPQRHGRRWAPASLGTPIGLVWHLTRGSVLGWAIGGFLTGLLATSLAAVVNEIGTKIEAVQKIFESLSQQGGLESGMVVIFYIIAGVLAACAAVQTVCRARQEEVHGTAEPVLASAVDRVRWLGGYLVVAFAAVVLTIAGALLGSTLGAARSETGSELMNDAVVAGLGQGIAACVFLSITALVFVLVPRATIVAGWVLVLVGLIIGMFGPLFSLPDWLTGLSPFTQTPELGGNGDIDLKGVWWLTATAVVAAVASLGLMRRRELHPAG